MHKVFLAIFLLAVCPANAQKKPARLQGIITDDNGFPLSGVSVIVLGKNSGINTSDSGTFQLVVPAGKAFAVVFSHMGYRSEQRDFILNEDETEWVRVQMEKSSSTLQSVTVTDNRQRTEAGLVSVNARDALMIPTPAGGVESLIKVLVGSNNELSSQYTVRGGNYDENLVYVNDFEVFRPYLVRSGQQEGLSFINPELARNVNFYNGGFQARYGDRMSSVLDVQYRKPTSFGGSAYISLLEQGVHLEGSGRDNRFTYLVGARNRSNRNLLSSQETQGNYVPSSSDLQSFLTYKLNARNSIEFLANLSSTSFRLSPEFSQLTSSVFSPYYTMNLGLDIYFEGKEQDRYATNMLGLSLVQQPSKSLRLKWMAGKFSTREEENIDITGAYLFGDREFDKSRADYGMITNPLGAGLFQTYVRNTLDIDLYNFSHKGSLAAGGHYVQWGQTIEQQKIRDKLYEWEYQDSAGYNIPYNPNQFEMSRFVESKANLDLTRFSGYIQDNIVFNDSAGFSIQAGIRYNYNTMNKEILISPRAGFSFVPHRWKRDIVFRAALGMYHQPPFYRELRDYNGVVNTSLKAQKSWQVSGGFDYSFSFSNRPFRLTSELYYKNMWDVVPYDIDNVRVRYAGSNSARAYAAGLEMRLFGELVKDAESWISLGFMRTRENLDSDYYHEYTIDENNQPIDSTLKEGGWFRRPTDRLFNFGMFLQDYLATNKNFKVYLNLLYGSNMPFNIPHSIKYRNGLIIDPYIRIDLGFSALLMDADRSRRRSHHPFRNFENIWATLEVFNLIDRDNTISYMLLKDFSNTTYAMPNRLTPRLVNLKLLARF